MPPPPLWDRMTPAEVDKVATLISSGVVTVEDAFLATHPTSTAAIWRALAAGREISTRQEDGGKLTEKERRGLEFYRKIQQAQARRTMWLMRAGLGVEIVGGKVIRNVKTESPNAMKILLLTCRELRTPVIHDPDELAAIAARAAAERGTPQADSAAPVNADPTPAQREAWLRKEAAALGLIIAPKEQTP